MYTENRRRPPTFQLYSWRSFVFIAILALALASVGILSAVDGSSALQVFNERFTAKPQDTI
jgi:hypothetical protein